MNQALRDRLARDPHRPRYHFLPPAHWMNDPNGPLQYKGEYHMFYQHNPDGAYHANMHWGHAVSRDLVHWRHLPIALAPTPGGPDKDGIWSGCAVVHEGVPTIMYTGVRPQVQCLAMSHDDMLTWQKYPGNPVIAAPPEGLTVTGFRDPFAWREGDEWRVVIGSGIEGVGGAALLYRSCDLIHWEYLGPLCIGKLEESGKMWECPNFFPLGDKHLLAVSPYGRVIYFLGGYDGRTFTPQTRGLLDFGESFYAPNCLLDERGRRIMWGWLKEGRSKEAQIASGWSGVHSLPRELFLHPDGALGMRPVAELGMLRRAHRRWADLAITPEGSHFLGDWQGDTLEIIAAFAPGDAAEFGLVVRRAPDGSEQTIIAYNVAGRRLSINGERSSLDETVMRKVVGGEIDRTGFGNLSGLEALTLHVYLDRSVIEVFANERSAIAYRVYPTRQDSLGVDCFAVGGRARLAACDVWEIGL